MIPQKIKIGLYEYKVIITDKPIIIDGSSNYNGKVDFENFTIEIKSSLPKIAKMQVFWHEIMHGVLNYFNVDHEDESIVDRVSKGVLMVLMDNGLLKESEDCETKQR